MKSRTRLDRKKVLDAAINLINTERLDSLTLQRLADRLSIRLPSLYNHIDGLPGLRHDLALASAIALVERMADAVAGISGEQAVLALANAYRTFALEQPGLYLAGIRSSFYQNSSELDIVQSKAVNLVETVLIPFGLINEDAIHAIRGLRSLIHGFVMLEISGGFGIPLDCNESFTRLVKYFIEGIKTNRVNNSQ
jgi:AcrR family transcriptional regulator